MKSYKRSIFLFHRDLRLEDNTGLIEALKQSEQVLPLFIFTIEQVRENDYASKRAIRFMAQSLVELDKSLRDKKTMLWVDSGKTEAVLEKLIDQHKIEAIFSNTDYTPYSRKRDKNLKSLATLKGIQWHQSHDSLLATPGEVLTGSGEPYKVYTPFYKNASQKPIREVEKKFSYENFFKKPEKKYTLDFHLNALYIDPNQTLRIKGGRSQAKKILKDIGHFSDYKQTRDYPALDSTTHLSPHNKFGTVSIREVYWTIHNALGKEHRLIGELFWRDFFTHVAYFFPEVFGKEFQEQYRKLSWRHNTKDFEKWCAGETGFPIVDAGMRELNQTGYMHNRVRMIVASFLTKDLRIDWRWGEKYFATQLIDYDPCVNNGSWQWAASTGCDAQPYFRIFNPWSQQQKFDPDCKYIKRWIPELQDLSPKEIHGLEKGSSLFSTTYPKQMVNHSEERQKTLDWFRVGKI